MKSAWPWCTFLSYSWIWFIEISEVCVYVCCVCLPICLYSLQNWSITSFVSSFSGFGVGIALALVEWVWWCSLPAYFIEQTEEHWCWLSLKVCLNQSVGLTVYRPSLLITWLWVLLNLHVCANACARVFHTVGVLWQSEDNSGVSALLPPEIKARLSDLLQALPSVELPISAGSLWVSRKDIFLLF